MCTTVDRSFEVSANTGNIACLGLTCNREGKPGDLILMSKSARNEIRKFLRPRSAHANGNFPPGMAARATFPS